MLTIFLQGPLKEALSKREFPKYKCLWEDHLLTFGVIFSLEGQNGLDVCKGLSCHLLLEKDCNSDREHSEAGPEVLFVQYAVSVKAHDQVHGRCNLCHRILYHMHSVQALCRLMKLLQILNVRQTCAESVAYQQEVL